MTKLVQPGLRVGAVQVPPSKSLAHRGCIAAALAGQVLPSAAATLSDDEAATRKSLAALLGEATAPAVPFKGRSTNQMAVLPCAASASTLRFLIPLSLVLRGGADFTGTPGLFTRPLAPYLFCLGARGVAFERKENGLSVRGRLRGGTYALRGDLSSQFVSGLLFALPLLAAPSRVVLTTPLQSENYVNLTLNVLAAHGILITRESEAVFSLSGGQVYQQGTVPQELDYSMAAFFICANAIGSRISLAGLPEDTAQGDHRVLGYVNQLAQNGSQTLDFTHCPDLIPPLAVVAALRCGQHTRFEGAERLRLKECDRLEAVAQQLTLLGAKVTEGADFLEFEGVSALHGGRTSACDDHRIAMMLGIAATRATGPVEIDGAESVAKSYPTFWDDWAKLRAE